MTKDDQPLTDDQLVELHLRAGFLGERLDPLLALRLVREVGALRADLTESDRVRVAMAELLTGVANALNGPPTGDVLAWSWDDLPVRVAVLVADHTELRRLAERIGSPVLCECPAFVEAAMCRTCVAAAELRRFMERP